MSGQVADDVLPETLWATAREANGHVRRWMGILWRVTIRYGQTFQWIVWLVVSNMNFIFHHVWDVILPIDFHIFQDGKVAPPTSCYSFFRDGESDLCSLLHLIGTGTVHVRFQLYGSAFTDMCGLQNTVANLWPETLRYHQTWLENPSFMILPALNLHLKN